MIWAPRQVSRRLSVLRKSNVCSPKNETSRLCHPRVLANSIPRPHTCAPHVAVAGDDSSTAYALLELVIAVRASCKFLGPPDAGSLQQVAPAFEQTLILPQQNGWIPNITCRSSSSYRHETNSKFSSATRSLASLGKGHRVQRLLRQKTSSQNRFSRNDSAEKKKLSAPTTDGRPGHSTRQEKNRTVKKRKKKRRC
ncbi:hypothetical protein LY76DRAFT_208457 [Colletotrichum caudatum]|nr:hypothetical protein LY76DRAFT_208457 [Colletotrichum caudatum]